MKKLLKGVKLSLVTSAVVVAFSACGGGGGSTPSDLITHNGVTYKSVKSPVTGRVWLDRNIGAAEVCSSYNDVACYGDYFQWGRNPDGHEDSNSGITPTKASSVDNVGNNLFIKGFQDWTSADSSGAIRSANWSKTDGSSVCPKGFRVPTIDELKAEVDGHIHNREDAFNSFLKLPSNGLRVYSTGVFMYVGAAGSYWSSTPNATRSFAGYFTPSNAVGTNAFRATGAAVRCIKN